MIDYIEFKKALKQIGGIEKAGKYWEIMKNAIDDLTENEFKNNTFAVVGKGFPGNAKYFPEIDNVLMAVNELPPPHKKLILSFLIDEIRTSYLVERPILEYLNSELKTLISQPKTLVSEPEIKPGKKLSHAQIAIIYSYSGQLITSANCNDIATKYGWNAPKSGESIRQEFSFWQHPTNRHGKPDAITSQPLRNKINLIESTLSHIPETHRRRAIDEVKILKSHLLKDWEEEL